MSLNLAYTYKTCDRCTGTGALPELDDDGDALVCEACDGRGSVATRRPTLEIAQQHLLAAERYSDQAEGDGDSAYFRTRANEHMALANTYIAMAQAEAQARIAAALWTENGGDEFSVAEWMQLAHEHATSPYR